MNRAALVPLLALLLAGCASGSSGDEASPAESTTAQAEPSETTYTATAAPVTASAVIAISPAHAIADGDLCMAWGDYTDFNDDQVQGQVLDATGTTVGVGYFSDPVEISDGCVRSFTVDVPAGGGFYTLKVGERTSDAVAEADLASDNLLIVFDG
ncbi:hypothetical protein OEB99_16510 [Actinotalea sp. M2MS4P-6]|uniref:hypothetical protein n=1 Tax=Actinotalea sp. M2MS4P-6 TaxID=2983762 RepID=UPI0021E43960|nr:hypothetical protein [Actinotalea sp. M2MS4P-6]MCV2395919.1 hypothetical protein [Actinotalea sp. M2MS4P-6]